MMSQTTTTPEGTQSGTAGAGEEPDCRGLSRALRRGIVAYDFKPVEVLLLLVLCEETYDAGAVVGRVNFAGWARRLGWREDKVRRLVWGELVGCLVVDFNEGQGTFELRPDWRSWSRARALRVPEAAMQPPELELRAERPLSESLSEVSRDGAAAQQWGWEAVRRAIEEPGAAEKSATVAAEKSAVAVAEKSAAQKSPVNAGRNGAAEKSAGLSLASLAFKKEASLAKGSAEKSAAAWRWLESVDRQGALSVSRFEKQWRELATRNPRYVLGALKGTLEATKTGTVGNPVAYLARKAREDGELR